MPLSSLPHKATADLEWLSAPERERLSAISSALRRRQFLAGRWLAREMACRYWGGSPTSWEITTSENGAPVLVSCDGNPGKMQISLSHSQQWAACSVAEVAVGLDLEVQSRPRNLEALAQHVFSPEENAQLHAIPVNQREEAFYRYWTLKEARGKQRGTGLRIHESRQLTFRECRADLAEATTWQRDGLTLALFAQAGIRAELIDWPEAPLPQFWRADPVTNSETF
jgi:4'-phosphopantetheinyl transferase